MSNNKLLDAKKAIKVLSTKKRPEGDLEGVAVNSNDYLSHLPEEEEKEIVKAEHAILNYIFTKEGKPYKRGINTLNKQEGVSISVSPSQYGEIDEYTGEIKIEPKTSLTDEDDEQEIIRLTF